MKDKSIYFKSMKGKEGDQIMAYGKKDLKKDLNKHVDSLSEQEKQEFISQLVTYVREMSAAKDGDTWTDDLMSGIDEWLEEYFMPLNKDKTLNTALTEERLGKFYDFHTEKKLEAGTYLEGTGPHSAAWKQNYIFENNPNAPYNCAVSNLSYTFGMFGKYAPKACKAAYQKGEESLTTFLRTQVQASIQRKLKNATFDEMRALKKGHRLFNPVPMGNTAREKEIAKTEAPYDNSQPNYNRNFNKYPDKIDLSFISSKKAARSLRRAQMDSYKSPMRTLSDQLGEMEDFLNSKENSRWRDSSYMKDVKKKLKSLRDMIDIQGSGTPEKRIAIAEAYQQLQDSCAAYLGKRSGERSTDAGNNRQRAISRLSDFLNDNKVVQNMLEEDRKEAQAKQAAEHAAQQRSKLEQIPGMEMAKLLVMAETGASIMEVQKPDAFVEQKEAAQAKISQAMAQMKQGKDNSAMAEILGTCAKSLSSIDVQKEALTALGYTDKDNLTQGQIEIAMKAPANNDKLNDFLYQLSANVKAASKELNGAPLQELRTQMEQDEKWKAILENGKKAEKSLTEELEPEEQLYKLRKDLEEGYAYEDPSAGISYLSPEEIATYRQAAGPVRNKIARGEFKWEMSEKKAAKEKRQEPEKMDFNALNRENEQEQAKANPKKNISSPVKRPELEHPESSKKQNSLGK